MRSRIDPKSVSDRDTPSPVRISCQQNTYSHSHGNSPGAEHASSPGILSPHIRMQTSLGNRAVLRMTRAGMEPGSLFQLRPIIGNWAVARRLQSKVMVYPSGDAYEQQADLVADQVAATKQSGNAPGIQVRSSDPGDTGEAAAPQIVDDALSSPGQPLDAPTRAFMEPRFGRDFSAVRLHTDDRAAESAAAIGALAYTAGNDIVFAAGQHASGSAGGRHLLAHELTHVVQQNAAPTGLLSRKATAKDEEEKKKAVAFHQRQQMRVKLYVDDGLDVVPDPANPLSDDNLFHNTAQLVDQKKVTLTVLTPTHYSMDAFSSASTRSYFDSRKSYPDFGGDYDADPAVTAPGTVVVPKNTAGMQSPSGASFDNIQIFGQDYGIDEEDFKNTLVHEGQHAVDLHNFAIRQLKTRQATNSKAVQDWEAIFEIYKTEFRAFWLQPPPKPSPLALPDLDRLPPPGERKRPLPPAENKDTVTSPSKATCTACPASDTPSKATATSAKTGFKNRIQEVIFRHLIQHYPQHQFDCLYVCSPGFQKAVNEFDLPESVNLINSPRLLDFAVALQGLKPAMTPAELGQIRFPSAVQKLDALDWAFLGDARLSRPFWMMLPDNAPTFVVKAMERWAKRPPTPDEINQDLTGSP